MYEGMEERIGEQKRTKRTKERTHILMYDDVLRNPRDMECASEILSLTTDSDSRLMLIPDSSDDDLHNTVRQRGLHAHQFP